jgi:HK97 family phage prohead protease
MERRFLFGGNVRLEERADKTGPDISGYAAVFYDGTPETEFKLWDGMVERIEPIAFKRALKEKDDARALFNHDPNQLLGRVSSGTLELSSDKKGLTYRISPGDTTVARDVREHIKRGDLTGSSFAFRVTDERWEKENDIQIRTIKGVELFDVGPVTYPAYEGTTAATRDASDLADARRSWEEKVAREHRAKAYAARARVVELEIAGN